MITTVLIEDDLNWRIKLQVLLDELGIAILGVATNVEEAAALLTKHQPHFILADILLDNEMVFDLFKRYTTYCSIPTIFITTSDKELHYKEASIVSNYLYIVKPVHKLTLKSSIECLCGKMNEKKSASKHFIAIKGKYNQKIELPLEKIIYIEQKQHYSTLHTINEQFTIKKSLTNVMRHLNEDFIQIHRSHCINSIHIENFGIGLDSIKLKGTDLPVGLTFKERVKKMVVEKFSLK